MESYNVRLAKIGDENKIFDLCKQLHEENNLFEMDADSVYEAISNATHGSGGIIGVIEGDGEFEGVVCLSINKFWNCKEWFLGELFSFVMPKYRRSTRAKSLLEFAKKCSDEMKIPLVVGVVSNAKTDAKIKLYERQLPKAGAFFVYNRDYARTHNHGNL